MGPEGRQRVDRTDRQRTVERRDRVRVLDALVERTRAELANYKADNSSTLAFVEECCTLKPDSEVLREELYNSYHEYCATVGSKPVSQKRFNNELEGVSGVSRGSEAVTRRRTWRGIRLL